LTGNWALDPVKEERQARRAEEQVQQYVVPALFQNIPPAPVWNRRRGRDFDQWLSFKEHVWFYSTKALTTVKAMGMLGNSSRGLFFFFFCSKIYNAVLDRSPR